MECYLLIANDIDIGTAKLSARDLCMSRISKSAWPLNRRTPNRHKLMAGDRVIFYLAGARAGVFAGTATLSSAAFIPSLSTKREMMATDDESLGSEFLITFEGVEMFSAPLQVRSIIGRLEFLAGAGRKWGVRLQGGVKKISAKDYETIVQGARRC